MTAALGPEKRGSHFENAVIGMKTQAMEAQSKDFDLENGNIEKPIGDEKVESIEKR